MISKQRQPRLMTFLLVAVCVLIALALFGCRVCAPDTTPHRCRGAVAETCVDGRWMENVDCGAILTRDGSKRVCCERPSPESGACAPEGTCP